jgi:hypothetical protein
MKLARIASLSLLLGGVAAAPARADVIVVDPHGGPGAALLQAALDGAQPGDIVLIRPGDYSMQVPLQLQGKALSLVGDGADVELPNLDVTAVPTGQLMVLRGLHVGPFPNPSTGPRIRVSGSGSLWIETCYVLGNDGQVVDGVAVDAHEGLVTQGLDLVLLANSSFSGGNGLSAETAPGGQTIAASFGPAGARIEGPRLLALHQAWGLGGAGGDGEPVGPLGSNGGTGLLVSDTQVMVQSSYFIGGREGENNPASTLSGIGVQFNNATVITNGFIAYAGDVQGVGTAAEPVVLVSSQIIESFKPATTITIDGPVREFETAHVHVDGAPFSQNWMFFSLGTGGLWQPKFSGIGILDPALPVVPVFLGVTTLQHTLDVYAPVPALPAGMDGLVLFGQQVVMNGPKPFLGGAASLVWISAAL